MAIPDTAHCRRLLAFVFAGVGALLLAGSFMVIGSAQSSTAARSILPITLFGGLAALWLGLNGIVLWSRRFRRFVHPAAQRADGPTASLRLHIGWWAPDSTYPVYRVTAYQDGVQLTPVPRWLRFILPTYVISRREIGGVRTEVHARSDRTAVLISLPPTGDIEVWVRTRYARALEAQLEAVLGS